MNASPAKKIAAVVLGLLAAGLGACAGGPGPANSASPSTLEPRIQALVDANRRYPRWSEFPATPTDLPEPVAIAGQVNALRIGSRALAAEVARIEWTLNGAEAEAWSEAVAARVAAVPVSPDARRTQQEIDEFARSLRDRGRAPPPIPRR